MTIVKCEPFDFELLNNQMEKLLDDLNYPRNLFSPKIDIYEDEKNIFLEIELPGFKKDDIKLTFENNALLLKGEKPIPENFQSRNYILSERKFGSFSKKFNFQENVNPEKISAEFENGVLHIAVEKMENDTPKERQIKVS